MHNQTFLCQTNTNTKKKHPEKKNKLNYDRMGSILKAVYTADIFNVFSLSNEHET